MYPNVIERLLARQGVLLSVGSALQLTQYDIDDVQTYCHKKCAPIPERQLLAPPAESVCLGAVTASEIEGLYRRFRALDRRHKGYVSSDELMVRWQPLKQPCAACLRGRS